MPFAASTVAPPDREALLTATSDAFDNAVLTGNLAEAYTYVDGGIKTRCTLANFGPLANIAYSLAKGATSQVTARVVAGARAGTILSDSAGRGRWQVSPASRSPAAAARLPSP